MSQLFVPQVFRGTDTIAARIHLLWKLPSRSALRGSNERILLAAGQTNSHGAYSKRTSTDAHGSERNNMNKSSDLAALQARCEALQREQAELARFALIGQAFIGLTHELNNALNSMMLQTSVVQMRVDEQGRQELAAIRQHGAQAAGLVRTLQHAVQERREKSYAVDLNSVLAEILDEESELHHSVSLVLSPKTPVIHSTRSAVKQLIRLL